jgi:hypothetical protein
VSGGGYIGTGLTRWMLAKADDGMAPSTALGFAQSELERLRSADYVKNRVTGTLFEEEGPLAWLRMHTNYLSRRLSLFSADAWTIIATYLRNLFIVWMMFWPWVAAFLFVPWFSVWLGGFPHSYHQWLQAVSGIAGSAVGVLGASYFFQGTRGVRHANNIPWPVEGDNRAAFGAVLLLTACLAVSYGICCDVDHPAAERSTLDLLSSWRVYVPLAVIGTQLGLAALMARKKERNAQVVVVFAAVMAAAIQLALIYLIARVLADWSHAHGEDKSAARLLDIHTIVRSLLTPIAILAALLLGETVKAALRSTAEFADQREHQGRTHAFIVMFISAWAVSSTLVIIVPAILASLGPFVPALTATGSGVSLSVSIYFGYRQSSPGKPDARAPLGFTLLGSIGMILLAIVISICAWKAFETTAQGAIKPNLAHCVCAESKTDLKKDFQPPDNPQRCSIPSEPCVERPFLDYFDALLHRFDPELLLRSLAVLAFSAVVLFFLGNLIRMNEFSLHGFNRDRLIRGFYGGFRGIRRPRKPVLFTGFDPLDDATLYEVATLYPERLPKFDTEGQVNKPPFLVVNTALNLVKGEALAWQERKADSFTFTALRAGNYRLGYRHVTYFAQGVKLGTAMAISGAAFNPNMGYNSSGPMSFLMSVFNVRLGWWLGNPKERNWRNKDPTWSSWRLLQEAAGQTTDSGPWIHLSDGGHFDNMGLWEMVHRRCRNIVVIDASQDKNFSMEDFYAAIRKIRIDMGIEIDASGEPVMLFPRSARASGRCFSRFRIRYSKMNGGVPAGAPDGTILYLKPCIYGREPPDVLEYAEKHADFPHESTADQFFSESQFESYRRLGEWEMTQLLKDVLTLLDDAEIPDRVSLSPINANVGEGLAGAPRSVFR